VDARSGRARHRLAGLAGIAVVVAVGMGVSLAAFEVAARTEGAFPSYLERANVGELVVNPSLSDARAAELITTTPGVTGYATDDLLVAGIDPERPITQAELDTAGVQVRMSSDGRYLEQDRPVVEEGRMLRDGPEVFLNRDAAEELGLEVGAEITLAFFRPSFNTPGVGPAQDDVVEPSGRGRRTSLRRVSTRRTRGCPRSSVRTTSATSSYRLRCSTSATVSHNHSERRSLPCDCSHSWPPGPPWCSHW